MKKFDLFVAAYNEPLLSGVSAEKAVKELIALNGGRIVDQHECKFGFNLTMQPTHRPVYKAFISHKLEDCYKAAISSLFTQNIKESK